MIKLKDTYEKIFETSKVKKDGIELVRTMK